MILILLKHQWKSFIRSRNSGRSIVLQIVMGFFILYFLSIAIFLGISLNGILKELFPKQDIVKIFCGFILYYFSFDIMLRFMLQDLPTLAVQPYLLQNIRKSALVGFLNVRSLFSFFNTLPLILFIPFSATVIVHQYGNLTAVAFISSIIALCIGNHFMVLFIKRKTIISSWWMVGFFIVIISFIACEHFKIFSIRNISAQLFIRIINQPIVVVLPILYLLFSFRINYAFLLKNLYFDEGNQSSKVSGTADYTWLQRFGIIGELVGVEMKMILRNKRPRSLLMLSGLILFYGFIFYKPEYFDKDALGFVLVGGIFVTGAFIINYGQFLLAWHSDNFDGLMTRNMDIKTFFKSRFMIMIIVSTISLLFSLFYGFINWKIIPIEIAAYFFNVGIQTVISAYFSTLNYKAIDLSRNASFNYQGLGATQWLFSLLILLIGAVIYFPFALLINTWAGIFAIGFFGLISLLLQDWWIDLIIKKFSRNKYKILSGFREK